MDELSAAPELSKGGIDELVRLIMIVGKSREADEIDELIEGSDCLPPDTPPPLSSQILQVRLMQHKLAKQQREKGKFQVFHNETLRSRMKEEGIRFPIRDEQLSRDIQRVDYSFPFLLNVKEFFENFKRKSKLKTEAVVPQSKSSQCLPVSVSPHTNRPITVKMLKDNPEGHGLDQRVISKFSDESETVDIRVKIGGRNKRVKAFKDGSDLIFPCAGKNCRDKHVGVSLCQKRVKLDEPEEDDDEIVPVAVGADVSIIEDENGSPLQLDDSIPQIMSVQSLTTPNFLSRLSPLASQLPNPIRPMTNRSNNRRRPTATVIPTAASLGMTTGIIRPTILSSKSAQQSAASIAPEILLQQPSVPKRRPTMNRRLTIAPTLNANSGSTFVISNPNEREVINQVVSQVHKQQQQQIIQAQNAIAQDQDSDILIQNVSHMTEAELSNMFTIVPLDEFETDAAGNDSPNSTTIPATDNGATKTATVVAAEESMVSEENSNKESEELESSQTTPKDGDPDSASINIATNIFEADDEDSDVPQIQIVSTVGNAKMPPSNAGSLAGIPITKHIGNKQPPSTVARAATLARYPEKKLVSGKEFVACRTCSTQFPSNCLQLYRVHMRTQHNIEIQPSSSGNKPDADGSVGTVIRVGQTRLRHVANTNPVPTRSRASAAATKTSTNSTIEMFKCKTCDQLLQKKETPDHIASCCPGTEVKAAFDVVHLATTRPLTRSTFCGLCDMGFVSTSDLRNHLVRHHSEHAHKMILEPSFRCSNCLIVFDDSIHLGLHVAECEARKAANGDILLDLARSMLQCGVCNTPHPTITQTQDCYTRAGLIRCLLCLHTVESRGNFFSHMKSFHGREGRGIRCPFCEIGELNFRDLFIHVLEDHYNPILKLHSSNSSILTLKNKAFALGTPKTTPGPSPTLSSSPPVVNKVNLGFKGKQLTASRLVAPLPRSVNQKPSTVVPTSRLAGFRPIFPIQARGLVRIGANGQLLLPATTGSVTSTNQNPFPTMVPTSKVAGFRPILPIQARFGTPGQFLVPVTTGSVASTTQTQVGGLVRIGSSGRFLVPVTTASVASASQYPSATKFTTLNPKAAGFRPILPMQGRELMRIGTPRQMLIPVTTQSATSTKQ